MLELTEFILFSMAEWLPDLVSTTNSKNTELNPAVDIVRSNVHPPCLTGIE